MPVNIDDDNTPNTNPPREEQTAPVPTKTNSLVLPAVNVKAWVLLANASSVL